MTNDRELSVNELVTRIVELRQKLCESTDYAEAARAMLKRAVGIMAFHTGRCPMNINNNYSGMEEHLSEYRAVIKEGDALLKSENEIGQRKRFADLRAGMSPEAQEWAAAQTQELCHAVGNPQDDDKTRGELAAWLSWEAVYSKSAVRKNMLRDWAAWLRGFPSQVHPQEPTT